MSTYEQGVVDALTAALRALDGHGFHDTAHDRIRRMLACDECGHQPEKHNIMCQERVFRGPGPLADCHCIEYEVRLPSENKRSVTPTVALSTGGSDASRTPPTSQNAPYRPAAGDAEL